MAVFSGPEIVNSGLRVLFDKDNINSYSGSGSAWKDLVRNTTYADTQGTGAGTGAGSEAWMGSVSTGITISLILHKIGTHVGYAEHPVNKWTGTTDASFVLYHFGTTSGGDIDSIKWYGNRGGTWSTISGSLLGVNGNKYHIALQYNNTTGGQMWVNGVKRGPRTGSGARADTTAQLRIYGPVGTGTVNVENCYMWDRELTDSEIQQNFEAIRTRYNL